MRVFYTEAQTVISINSTHDSKHTVDHCLTAFCRVFEVRREDCGNEYAWSPAELRAWQSVLDYLTQIAEADYRPCPPMKVFINVNNETSFAILRYRDDECGLYWQGEHGDPVIVIS